MYAIGNVGGENKKKKADTTTQRTRRLRLLGLLGYRAHNAVLSRLLHGVHGVREALFGKIANVKTISQTPSFFFSSLPITIAKLHPMRGLLRQPFQLVLGVPVDQGR